MPSLKDLKNRIKSVKNTQKITKAMKMVSAAKLRRAREQAEASRSYADMMQRMMGALAASFAGADGDAPLLLKGTGRDDKHLLIVISSDRGLCGGLNGNIFKAMRNKINELEAAGKEVKIFCIGKKIRELAKSKHSKYIVERLEGISRKPVQFEDAEEISNSIMAMYDSGVFDICTIIYPKFLSAISQQPTFRQIIPLNMEEASTQSQSASYEFEPSEEEIINFLLPMNLTTQIFVSLLESSASEHGSRMTAMDNATRNAGDMIKDLSLVYNRSRQAAITKELIEIISGAEAV